MKILTKNEDQFTCPDCRDTGLIDEGEFDDHTEKRCHCQLEDDIIDLGD